MSIQNTLILVHWSLDYNLYYYYVSQGVDGDGESREEGEDREKEGVEEGEGVMEEGGEEEEEDVICIPLESLGLGGNKIGDGGAMHIATGLTSNKSMSCDLYYRSLDLYYRSCNFYYRACDIYCRSCDFHCRSCDLYCRSCDFHCRSCDLYNLSCDTSQDY